MQPNNRAVAPLLFFLEQYLSDEIRCTFSITIIFLIIRKSIFFDNDNLPISCKNADISAVDIFFENIAHPYMQAHTIQRPNGPYTDQVPRNIISTVLYATKHYWMVVLLHVCLFVTLHIKLIHILRLNEVTSWRKKQELFFFHRTALHSQGHPKFSPNNGEINLI